MAVWSVPKLGTELLEIVESVLNSLGTIWVVCVIIYAINYGLDVVGPEMAMGCLVSGLPTDNPLLVQGLLKTIPVCLVGPKIVHVCCKQNIA